jgi:hypothetical protein
MAKGNLATIKFFMSVVTDTNFDPPEMPLDSNFKVMVDLVKLSLKVYNICDIKHLL